LAVSKLMTSSNLVGCSTGMSAEMSAFENVLELRVGWAHARGSHEATPFIARLSDLRPFSASS
jgi:hypothetical protein